MAGLNLISAAAPTLQGDSITGNLTGRSISTDGRYVVFSTTATNLTGNDQNNNQDILVWDVVTGSTTLISANTSNTATGNNASVNPQISGDGRYVVFESDASDLFGGDFNGVRNIFVRDLLTGVTTMVDRSTTGTIANSSSSTPLLSRNGRYVLFNSYANNLVTTDTNAGSAQQDVFVYDLQTNTTNLVSVNSNGIDSGNNFSSAAAISADGRYAVLISSASDLVANDLNNADDIFVRDLVNGTTTLVSRSVNGIASANDDSGIATISEDGRFVLFVSAASDLVANDTNGTYDLFVRDLQANTTTLVSVNSSGTDSGNGYSLLFNPQISSDGRFVLFVSAASDLVVNDTNGSPDIFLRDLQTGQTTLISLNSHGTNSANAASYNPILSSDGRYVTFQSAASDLVVNDTNNKQDVFVRDLQTQITTLISRDSISNNSGNSNSYNSIISSDGRYVAFYSEATNLTAGDTNNNHDLFAQNLQTNTIDRLSLNNPVSASGNNSSFPPLPLLPLRQAVGGNGRYVVFESSATNLVAGDFNNSSDVFIRDVITGTTQLLSVNHSGSSSGNYASYSPTITPDGKFVVFSSYATDLVTHDLDIASENIYLSNLETNTTTLVSVNGNGIKGNGSSNAAVISNNGRYIAFNSEAKNLTAIDTNDKQDVLIKDLQTGAINLVSVNINGNDSANNASYLSQISHDGRYVMFTSVASDLVANDTNNVNDIFIRDLQTNTTTLVSANSNNIAGNKASSAPMLSQNGRYVVFYSDASNLATGDTNNLKDVFVRDLQNNTTQLVSINSSGTGSGNGVSSSSAKGASISADGRYVVFQSDASNLVTNDPNGKTDVFLRDLQTNTTTLISRNLAGTASGNGASRNPIISGDGRYVVFQSDASDLVSSDSNGSVTDIFVRDLLTNTTTLISKDNNGNSGNATASIPFLSEDGSYILFGSTASNLVAIDHNNNRDIFGFRLLPVVTNIVPSTVSINDPVSIIGSFTLTIAYSGAMNTNVAPTLAFPTNGEDPASTLALTAGNWSNNTTYVATYAVTDANQVLSNIDIKVTGAQSVDGKPQAEATYRDVFNIDTIQPTATIAAVTPDPRTTSVATVALQFSEAVQQVDLSDFSLSRDGVAIDLTSATLTQTNNTWTIGSLDALTNLSGNYQLTLAPSDITDLAGNSLAASATETWQTSISITPTPEPIPTPTPTPTLEPIPTPTPEPTPLPVPPVPTPDPLPPQKENSAELGTPPAAIDFTGKRGVSRRGTALIDRLSGTPYTDILRGGKGNDHLKGNQGNDRLFGDSNNDRLDGGNGDDWLEAGKGNDVLLGGSGNDVLLGGIGQNSVTGGTGNDVFLFNLLDQETDRITDFNASADLIDLRPIFQTAQFNAGTPFDRFKQFVQLVQVGANTEVRIDHDGHGAATQMTTLLTILNKPVSNIGSRNFLIT